MWSAQSGSVTGVMDSAGQSVINATAHIKDADSMVTGGQSKWCESDGVVQVWGNQLGKEISTLTVDFQQVRFFFNFY